MGIPSTKMTIVAAVEPPIVYKDLNFHEEPIISKEEPIDLECIQLPTFLVEKEFEMKKKLTKKTLSKPVKLSYC